MDERAGHGTSQTCWTSVLAERAGHGTSQTCWTSVLASLVDERAGQSCTFNGTSQTCWTSVLAMEPHKHLTNVLDERAGQSCTFHGTSQTCWTYFSLRRKKNPLGFWHYVNYDLHSMPSSHKPLYDFALNRHQKSARRAVNISMQ